MDEFKQPETSMESASLSNPREPSLLSSSVWQASNYRGARFHGTKDVVTAEIARVVSLEVAATGQTINQQQLDRLIDLSFRDFIGLPQRLKDSGHDSVMPQDFDELMEKLIRKYVSRHKLTSIRPTPSGRPVRAEQPRSEPSPLPSPPLRPPPLGPRPFPGD
jgi:hypothetical protein